MIKNSKLIGTKIAAPFGWKKFKVGELFDMHSPSGNGLYSSADGIKFDKDDFVRCTTSSRDCNGVPICLPRSSFGEILERGLSVASNGDAGSVFYHNDEFAVLQDSYALTLKSDSDKISDFTYLFLCAVLNKQFDLFSYTTKAVWKRYSTLKIELPITIGYQPDFEWMSAYIKAVKADYLEQKELSNRNEIEVYLSAGNVDSTDITDDERQFLRDFEKLPRWKFKVGELFIPTNPKRYDLKISDIIDNKGGTIVVSSTTVNQGIKGYSSMKPLVKGNKIIYSDAVGPSMMFYQENDFIADAHVKYLAPKFVNKINRGFALYIIACIQKSTLGIFGYGNKYNNIAVDNTIIELPVIDSSQIDTKSIEKYMQIQSKPLINNVVKTFVPVGGGGNLN